jgi:hypothetical protein
MRPSRGLKGQSIPGKPPPRSFVSTVRQVRRPLYIGTKPLIREAPTRDNESGVYNRWVTCLKFLKRGI